MNILAIDITTKKANVGISINGNNLVKSIDNEITHSEKLLPLIDEVLKASNCNLNDINLIACTTGPGSFTGIRIGLATIKAIAKITSAKIYTINSLELLANTIHSDNKSKLIVSLIDAKNTRAYYGIYIKSSANAIIEHSLGNKYIKDILTEIVQYCSVNNIDVLNEVLFVLDSENLINVLCEETNYNNFVSSLNIENLINLSLNATNYTSYMELDATYIRSSEAERTKYGE